MPDQWRPQRHQGDRCIAQRCHSPANSRPWPRPKQRSTRRILLIPISISMISCPLRSPRPHSGDFPEPKEADWHAYTDVNQRKKAGLRCSGEVAAIDSRCSLLPEQPAHAQVSRNADRDPERAARSLLHRRRSAPDEARRACWKCMPTSATTQRLRLDRRINVLIYLNKDWKEEYGGHFELWDREVRRAEKKILPVFNRCAIFSTTSVSFHGHPHTAGMPAGSQTRKSHCDLLLLQWPS